MARMIDNVLDFARGRLGGGLTLQRTVTPIGPLLEQVVGELQHGNPSRDIRYEGNRLITLNCDPLRIAQLVSNLVGNAVTHGAPDTPIDVRCSATSNQFVLTVTNFGSPIPEAAKALFFHPFVRGKVSGHKEGLGLGLYIASEIAAAHDGRLSVISDDSETCFTFSMPIEC